MKDERIEKTMTHIGATTVGTWETGLPTFRLGDQQCPPTSWPREPTNKHSSHAGFSIWVFKKFSGGDTPWHSQREGATLSRIQQPACGRVRGASARCWDPNLGHPKLFSRGCAHAMTLGMVERDWPRVGPTRRWSNYITDWCGCIARMCRVLMNELVLTRNIIFVDFLL